MAWTHYASTDVGATALSGTVDTLNAVLYACLVTGYGSKAGAGWSSPYYDSTSKTRVLQNAQGFCAQMIDNGPGAGGAREARIRGYESMSAYNVGIGPFPTVAQAANGLFIRKSATADATARAWDVYADAGAFLLLVETGDVASTCFCALFGRFAPDKLNDAWCQMIVARGTENSSNTNFEAVASRVTALTTVTAGTYIVRDVNGSQPIGSIAAGLRSDPALSALATFSGAAGMTYPDPATGGLRLERVYAHESATPRGYVRGLWQPMHVRPLAHRATETYMDGSVTRTLRAFYTGGNGEMLIEESDTVDL